MLFFSLKLAIRLQGMIRVAGRTKNQGLKKLRSAVSGWTFQSSLIRKKRKGSASQILLPVLLCEPLGVHQIPDLGLLT